MSNKNPKRISHLYNVTEFNKSELEILIQRLTPGPLDYAILHSITAY